MRRILALSCSLATLAILALPAAAQEPRTVWRCFYVPAESPLIGCMLATAPLTNGGTEPASRLPALAARIRRDPASLDGETILIPLHAPPIEKAGAERLARSVMCGGTRRDCAVEFVERD